MRGFFVGIGYMMLIIGGEVWFVCCPLTAYTLYEKREFPLAYFGVSDYNDPGFDYWMPDSMRAPLGGLAAAFALYGLFTIYFNVRRLRKLRLGEN